MARSRLRESPAVRAPAPLHLETEQAAIKPSTIPIATAISHHLSFPASIALTSLDAKSIRSEPFLHRQVKAVWRIAFMCGRVEKSTDLMAVLWNVG
jgi:hypothetical protein